MDPNAEMYEAQEEQEQYYDEGEGEEVEEGEGDEENGDYSLVEAEEEYGQEEEETGGEVLPYGQEYPPAEEEKQEEERPPTVHDQMYNAFRAMVIGVVLGPTAKWVSEEYGVDCTVKDLSEHALLMPSTANLSIVVQSTTEVAAKKKNERDLTNGCQRIMGAASKRTGEPCGAKVYTDKATGTKALYCSKCIGLRSIEAMVKSQLAEWEISMEEATAGKRSGYVAPAIQYNPVQYAPRGGHAQYQQAIQYAPEPQYAPQYQPSPPQYQPSPPQYQQQRPPLPPAGRTPPAGRAPHAGRTPPAGRAVPPPARNGRPAPPAGRRTVVAPPRRQAVPSQ